MLISRLVVRCLASSAVVFGSLVMTVDRSSAADVVLVRGGQTEAVLVFPPEATELEQLAAQELSEHVQLITGGELPRGEADGDLGGKLPIYIGRAADSKLDAIIRQQGDDPASFALAVRADGVHLRGLGGEGTRNAAYELLEQLGVRWYMPGEFGRVLPESDTLTLAEKVTVQTPSFRVRQLAGWNQRRFPEWTTRMRNSEFSVSSGHGIRPFHTSTARRRAFPTNPEFFRLINGERAPGQLCLSNPELLKVVVDWNRDHLRKNPDQKSIGMGPNDGSGFCECDDCLALDGGVKTAFTNRRSITDRYFWFYNRVLEELSDEFPDLTLGTLLYSDQMDPPVREKPNRRIAGVIAAIHVCRIHGPNNPNCPEAGYRTWLTREWNSRLETVLHSGYWFNLACPGFPFPMIHRMRDEIPHLHRLGSLGIRRSTGINWAVEGPSLYLAAKLMWDVETDVDALLDEFWVKFYGPAAEPMRRYTFLLDHALRETDRHTGGSWDLLHIYDAEVREQARRHLKQARRLAGTDTIYATRVRVADEGWEYFAAFAAMMERRAEHDYPAAVKALQRVDALQHNLINAYEIQMLRDWQAESFLRLFFREATEQAYARVTDGNELAAGLDHRWQFLLEPQGIGERIGLHLPEFTGGNWQTVSTNETWSTYGQRYYWGEAWYRQTIAIPERFRNRRVMLWCAGVQDGAKVFVNGIELGTSPGTVFDLTSHGGSSQPFELDATDAIRAGEPNTVVFRIIRDRINQLGTGGLMGPVMFYAPADGFPTEN